MVVSESTSKRNQEWMGSVQLSSSRTKPLNTQQKGFPFCWIDIKYLSTRKVNLLPGEPGGSAGDVLLHKLPLLPGC